jgi:hypothetical protein
MVHCWERFVKIILSRELFKPLPKKLGQFVRVSEFGSIEKGYECTYKHNQTKIPVDIFLFYSSPTNQKYWSATYLGLCDKSKEKMCRWETSVFFLEKISFFGREYNVPSPIELFLEEKYGPNWNIPHSYSYFEGLNNGYYHGLILDDFADKNALKIQKEQKINNLWPSKIRKLGQPILWMYWQNAKGKTKPPYLDLCLETILKNCQDDYKIIILDDKMVKQLSMTINPNFTNIEPIGMRADYIRFTIIAEYGGLWLDYDTIVLKNLRFIKELLLKYNFIGFEHQTFGDLSIGFFAGNVYNRICLYMKYIFESEFGTWKKGPGKIQWAVPSKKLPNYMKLLNRVYPNEFITLPASKTVYPIDWKMSKQYFWSDRHPHNELLNNFSAICLHNETYGDEEKNQSREKIMTSNLCIAKIFRHVLQ